jgi:hypothetical protein
MNRVRCLGDARRLRGAPSHFGLRAAGRDLCTVRFVDFDPSQTSYNMTNVASDLASRIRTVRRPALAQMAREEFNDRCSRRLIAS